MMRGSGVRNVELLPNRTEECDSEGEDNDGDECAATFNGKKSKVKERNAGLESGRSKAKGDEDNVRKEI